MADPQGFPSLESPVTTPERRVTQAWYRFFLTLWNRTGGDVGFIVPPGVTVEYAGATIPNGYLLCDGQAVSRTTYAALFGSISTLWGVGDGSTTFNLPDFRGRSSLGVDGSHALGSTGGAASVTLSTANLPAHSHGVTDPGHTHIFTGVAHTHGITDPTHTHAFTGTPHGHGVTDPGHVHSYTPPGGIVAAAGGAVRGDYGATASTSGDVTNLTVNNATAAGTNTAAATGVTANNATAIGSNANTVTGVTTQNTGGGTAVATQSPYAAVHYIIKT